MLIYSTWSVLNAVIMRPLLFLALSSLLFSNFSNFSKLPIGVLKLNINNIEYNYGTLWIGVYSTAGSFLDKEKALLFSIKDPSKYKEAIYINNLNYGDYAIALFHDLNNNGTLDLNWLNIPTEPYAFSKPLNSKWKIPSFGDVKINLHQSQKTVNTTLSSWWEQ